MQDDPYDFPSISVCLRQRYGCDHEDADVCVTSTFDRTLDRYVKPVAGFEDSSSNITATQSEVREGLVPPQGFLGSEAGRRRGRAFGSDTFARGLAEGFTRRPTPCLPD